MNLYKLHSNPKELKDHDKAHANIPTLILDKMPKGIHASSRQGREYFKNFEHVFIKSPEYATWYAEMVLHIRWPEAEPMIMKDPEHARYYASRVINGRWKEAEPVIATVARSAAQYAKFVLKKRFPLGEKTIAKNGEWSNYYAETVLHGAFPEGEKAILDYAEKHDGLGIYSYASRALFDRWPEGEKILKKLKAEGKAKLAAGDYERRFNVTL